MKKLFLSLLSCLCMSACFSPQPDPLVYRYGLGSINLHASHYPARGSLWIPPAESASFLEGEKIPYTRADGEFGYYAKHAWIAPPAELIREQLQQTLQKTSAFRAVSTSPLNAQWLLKIKLQQLSRDYGARAHNHIRIAMSSTLLRLPSYRIVAEHHWVWDTPMSSHHAPVAAGIKAMQEGMKRLVKEIAMAALRDTN